MPSNRIDGSQPNLEKFFTPLEEAVLEIKRRREDKDLIKKVEDFFNTDIPEHFMGPDPICYLARHIATPNYETLHFIDIAKSTKLPIVIGLDVKDKFVTNNALKRALGKMPVQKGAARSGDEIIEHFTIIDFATAQGRQLKDIVTKFDQNLVDFHLQLLREVYPTGITLVDESDWVDRNHRGNILEHYKKMLALLIVHGVMFETYPPEEYQLVKETPEPAFDFIQEYFGCTPLIYNHISPEAENLRDWNAYPSVIYPYCKDSLKGSN